MFGVVLRFLATVAAVPLCGLFVPGVQMTEWSQAVLIGATLAVLYIALRPLARLLLTVLNWLTLGLVYVVVDAFLVWTAVQMFPGIMTLESIWTAVLMALVINAARTVIGALTGTLKA